MVVEAGLWHIAPQRYVTRPRRMLWLSGLLKMHVGGASDRLAGKPTRTIVFFFFFLPSFSSFLSIAVVRVTKWCMVEPPATRCAMRLENIPAAPHRSRIRGMFTSRFMGVFQAHTLLLVLLLLSAYVLA